MLGEGVSLVGAVAMLRSTLSAQRVAAARLLTRVLQQAAPARGRLLIHGTLAPQPVVRAGGGADGTPLDVAWHDVWTCLVEELNLAAALCAALEETARPHVAAAAMTALAALLEGVHGHAVGVAGPCFPARGWRRGEAGSVWGDDDGEGLDDVAARVAGRAVDILLDVQLEMLHAPALHMLARCVDVIAYGTRHLTAYRAAWVGPDATTRVAAAPAVLSTLRTLGHASATQGDVLMLANALCTAGHVESLCRAGRALLRRVHHDIFMHARRQACCSCQ